MVNRLPQTRRQQQAGAGINHKTKVRRAARLQRTAGDPAITPDSSLAQELASSPSMLLFCLLALTVAALVGGAASCNSESAAWVLLLVRLRVRSVAVSFPTNTVQEAATQLV